MVEAFYLPEGDGFVATEHTRGPWDASAQHGGPPSALVAHVIDRDHPREDAHLVRVTIEILRPVPLGRLKVRTTVVRGGRNVELVGAEASAGGATVLLARAWRIRTTELDVPEPPADPPPPPDRGRAQPGFRGLAEVGWHSSVEARFLSGAWAERGDACAWLRVRVPLVAGEELSPMERVLLCADAGNGISATLDFTRYVFVNTDLTVSCHRPLAGEWLLLDASTRAEPTGVGLAVSGLSDQHGPIGVASQSLYVAERP